MKLRESLTECPVCQKRLRFRYFCRKKLQLCENPHCQLAFGVYRTLAQVEADLAAAAEGSETSYEQRKREYSSPRRQPA